MENIDAAIIAEKKSTGKKAGNIIINVLTVVIVVFALFVAISAIMSSGKGYVNFFGKAYLNVATGSMAGKSTAGEKVFVIEEKSTGRNVIWHYSASDNTMLNSTGGSAGMAGYYSGESGKVFDAEGIEVAGQQVVLSIGSFPQGAAIEIKLISEEEKQNLKVGDVITFYDPDIRIDNSNKKQINTHRIVEITEIGGVLCYATCGDANSQVDTRVRYAEDIIGIVSSSQNAFASFLSFLQSSTGFLVCVVFPTILLLGYSVVVVVLNIIKYNNEKTALVKADTELELKEKLRAELLAEMQEQLKAEAENAELKANTENKGSDEPLK